MPVRVVIHSSEVSTSRSRSSFLRSFFGTKAPVPITRARITQTPSPLFVKWSAASSKQHWIHHHCLPLTASCLLLRLRLGQLLFAPVQLRDLGLDLLGEVLLRELRREPDRVLHRLRGGTAVTDDDAPLHAEQ